MQSDLEGVSEEFLEDLRQAAPTMPLKKIRTAKRNFERRLSALRKVHPESEHVSYSGPIDPQKPLDQIRFFEQACDTCDVEIISRERRTGKKTATPIEDSFGSEEDFTHDDDYRNVTFRGTDFKLTSNQARIVQFLHERYIQGTPEVSQARALEALGIQTSKFKDTFRSTPGLRGEGKLIVPGSRKGLVRLNISKKTS